MVYSRATTSAMAERPALGFWVFWVVDIFTSSLGERAMMLVEMLFRGSRSWTQDFRTKLARSQECRSSTDGHVRLLNLVRNQPTARPSSTTIHLSNLFCKDGVADFASCVFSREKQCIHKMGLRVVKAVSVKLAPARPFACTLLWRG